MSISLHASFMRWVVKHTWHRREKIPFLTLREEWMKMSGKAARSKRGGEKKRFDIRARVRKAESLTGFTMKKKVHLIFILDERVSLGFQRDLEKAQFDVQLIPDRRIYSIRSQDGSFVRTRADAGNYQPIMEVQLASLVNDAQDDIQVDEPAPHAPVPQEPQNPQVPVNEDQPGVEGMNQQRIKEDPLEEKVAPIKFEPIQENAEEEEDIPDLEDPLVEEEEDIPDLEDPVVVVPRVLTSTFHQFDAPTISLFLINLRAAVYAARFPGLNATMRNIEYAIRRHMTDYSKVYIDNVAQIWSSIILEDENDNQEFNEMNSVVQRRYFEVILHTGFLINCEELEDFSKELQLKIRRLDYTKRIRLETVKAGLNFILRAVVPRFLYDRYPGEEDEDDSEEDEEEEEEDDSEEDEEEEKKDDQDVVENPSLIDEALHVSLTMSAFIISMYASISALGTAANQVRKKIKKALFDDDINPNGSEKSKTASLVAVVSTFSSATKMATHAKLQTKSNTTISKRRYLEVIYEFLILLNFHRLGRIEAILKKKIDKLDYEPQIKMKVLKNGIESIIIAVTEMEDD